MSSRALVALLVCLAVLLTQSTLRVRSAPGDGECCLDDCCCQEVVEESCCTTSEGVPAATRLVDACGCGSSEHDGVTHAVVHTVFLELARVDGFAPRESGRSILFREPVRDALRASPEPPVPRSCVPARPGGGSLSVA